MCILSSTESPGFEVELSGVDRTGSLGWDLRLCSVQDIQAQGRAGHCTESGHLGDHTHPPGHLESAWSLHPSQAKVSMSLPNACIGALIPNPTG